jgi:hypothetical protein
MRTNLIELSCEDASSVCVLFVDGKQSALGRGRATARVRPGARVRWAVVTRRRSPGLLVKLGRGATTAVLFDGRCAGPVELGAARIPAGVVRLAAAARKGPVRRRAFRGGDMPIRAVR